MKEEGISKSELARRMGSEEKDVRRTLDPSEPTKAPAVERALAFLGRLVIVEIRKAA